MEGETSSVLPTSEALSRARAKGLDLVEITNKADPPVCKLLDFRRFLYEQRQKDQKSRVKKTDVKELRFGPNISENDLNVKIERAREFLEEKNKVKVTLQFRGRQITHQEFGRAKLDAFLKGVEDVAKVEAGPRLIGKLLLTTLAPK